METWQERIYGRTGQEAGKKGEEKRNREEQVTTNKKEGFR